MNLFSLSFLACDSSIQKNTSYLETMMLDVDGNPTSEIKVEIRDRNGDFYTESVSDTTGGLRIELPPYETFFAIVSYDNFRPISYTGFSGDGTFALPAGTLALREDSEFQGLSEWSSMCEGQIEGYNGENNFETVMVDGDIRLNISEQDLMSLPTLEGSVLHLIGENGQEYAACYGTTEVSSGEEGEGESEEEYELRTSTNTEGLFTFGAVPAGRYALHVEKEYEQGYVVSIEQLVFIPEGGNVPLYPVLFPLP